MIVRTARAEDAAAVAAVQVTTWQVAYAGLIPQAHLDALDVGARTEWWREILAGRGEPPGGNTIVADDAGAVLGFVAFGPARDPGGPGELYAIYVEPRSWGSGAGAALIRAAEAGLAGQGHAEAVLWVIDGNDRAQTFYERMGWELDGARRQDEIGGALIPEVRYRRILPAADRSEPPEAPET